MEHARKLLRRTEKLGCPGFLSCSSSCSGRMLWRALAGHARRPRRAVKAELEEAARLRREAESMLRDAEKQRADALTEAKALIEGARLKRPALPPRQRRKPRPSAKRREQMAIDRIAAAEKAAVDDVRLAAADVATTAARQVLAEGLTQAADAHLIDQAITQLPSALAPRRAA